MDKYKNPISFSTSALLQSFSLLSSLDNSKNALSHDNFHTEIAYANICQKASTQLWLAAY